MLVVRSMLFFQSSRNTRARARKRDSGKAEVEGRKGNRGRGERMLCVLNQYHLLLDVSIMVPLPPPLFHSHFLLHSPSPSSSPLSPSPLPFPITPLPLLPLRNCLSPATSAACHLMIGFHVQEGRGRNLTVSSACLGR